jgi:hypothetical protein
VNSLINFALLLIAPLGTLAAFGGKTYRDGSEWIYRRITVRGWISLTLLLLGLILGLWKEIIAQHDSAENKILAARNADLQKDILKLQKEGLEQITGGDGFPLATIIPQMPDDGNFNLMVSVQGKGQLSNVSFDIAEGVYKPPTPEELKKIIKHASDMVNGHVTTPSSARALGNLAPGYISPIGYFIHPSLNGVNTYRIEFSARNGQVRETLNVRFNESLKSWQYKYEVERINQTGPPLTPVASQDWTPKA